VDCPSGTGLPGLSRIKAVKRSLLPLEGTEEAETAVLKLPQQTGQAITDEDVVKPAIEHTTVIFLLYLGFLNNGEGVEERTS